MSPKALPATTSVRVAISIRVTSAIAYDVVLESAAAISTYRSRFIKYLQDMYALESSWGSKII